MQSISEVKTVPDGYHSVNLFLIAEGAEKLIQFLKQTFGGKVEESVKDLMVVLHTPNSRSAIPS